MPSTVSKQVTKTFYDKKEGRKKERWKEGKISNPIQKGNAELLAQTI